ncbi:MAG TPA: hypothetical protein VMU21_10410 [Thermodesulfovibrionales bacterium]|nr:hypothetical protein [Thermodesulfovibrionales bacterium]
MPRLIAAMVFLAQLLKLCMAVMTGRYDHIGMCACNLIELESAIGEFLVPTSGLMNSSSNYDKKIE